MTQRQKLWGVLALIVCLHGLVFLAGFVAPYDFAAQNREQPFAPPTRLHFIDPGGRFHFRPFVRESDDPRTAPVEMEHLYELHFFVRGAPYRIAGLFVSDCHLFGVNEPGKVFLLGTDAYGRDQFSRFLCGGQISLLAGLLAAAISVFLGALIGGIAGFYGGWVDEILMRGAELFLAAPWLYLLFAVRAALPLHIAEWQVFVLLVCILGLIGWARPARLIRGAVLSAKERNFVLASRGFGGSDRHIMLWHVLPQTYGIALTQMAVLIPQYVLAEVTLTFLGLGVGEPMPSWGSLLAYLQQYYVLASYWWMFLPALLLIPFFLAYYLLADALQEHLKSVPL